MACLGMQQILLAIQATRVCWVSIINWRDLAVPHRLLIAPTIQLYPFFPLFSQRKERKWHLTRTISKATFGRLSAFCSCYVAIHFGLVPSRPGLPKNNETYFFFKIPDGSEDEFRQALKSLVDDGQITTAEQALDDRSKIAEHKQSGDAGCVEVVGVNIAFCPRGLHKVRKSLPVFLLLNHH